MAIGSDKVQQSIRDILYVVFRHKKVIVAFFVLVVTLVTAVTFLMGETYRAEAKLMVRLGRENLSVDPSVSGPTVNPAPALDEIINSELSIFMSRELAEKVVDNLGEAVVLEKKASDGDEPEKESFLKKAMRTGKSKAKALALSAGLITELTPHEQAIKKVMASRKGEVEKRTSIMSVSYEASTPELAQKALEQLTNLYQDQHIKVYSSQASPQFFETQTEKLRLELADREMKLADFKNQYGISTLDKQKEVVLQQMAALETQRNEAAAQVGQSEAHVESLEKTIKNRSNTREISRTTGRTNYAADALKARLADLRQKETDMAARYPATHRPLIELRKQVQQAEEELGKETNTLTEVTTGVDTNYQQLQLGLDNEQSTLKAQRARLEIIENQLPPQKEQLKELAGREQELTVLLRNVELAEKEYRQYRDNLQRAKISNAMDLDKVSNVGIVQRPSALPTPVKPKRVLNLLLGVFAGLFGGLFFAFVLELIDDAIETEEDVKRYLGVPVLAWVSEKEFKACT